MWPQQRQSHIQPTRVYSKLAPSDPLKAQFRKSDQAALKEQRTLHCMDIYSGTPPLMCGTPCLFRDSMLVWLGLCTVQILMLESQLGSRWIWSQLWLCICVFVFVHLYLCTVQPLLLWITAWPAPSLIAISSAIDIDIILISTVNTTIVLSVVRFGIHRALWERPEVPLF